MLADLQLLQNNTKLLETKALISILYYKIVPEAHNFPV